MASAHVARSRIASSRVGESDPRAGQNGRAGTPIWRHVTPKLLRPRREARVPRRLLRAWSRFVRSPRSPRGLNGRNRLPPSRKRPARLRTRFEIVFSSPSADRRVGGRPEEKGTTRSPRGMRPSVRRCPASEVDERRGTVSRQRRTPAIRRARRLGPERRRSYIPRLCCATSPRYVSWISTWLSAA
jgi:hypothetical protein